MNINVKLAVMFLLAAPIAATFAAEAPWHAMIVFDSGRIEDSVIHGNKHACEEALSLAQNGITLEDETLYEKMLSDRAAKSEADYQASISAWRAKHPCTSNLENLDTLGSGIIKKMVKHCSMPQGGEQVFDDAGTLMWETFTGFSTTGSSVVSWGAIPTDQFVKKAVCFQ